VEAMTDTTRRELAPFGVSVSVVEPAFVKTEIANKQVGDHASSNKLSKEQHAVYSMFLDGAEEKRLKMEAMADTTDCTNEAIIHALSNPAPKTRYVVANVGGTPAWVLRKLLAVLPDRAADRLGGKVNK
jgi:NAD(P)-dependent dehydrogenase (short-subunit alcohol dehydrogenase family)